MYLENWRAQGLPADGAIEDVQLQGDAGGGGSSAPHGAARFLHLCLLQLPSASPLRGAAAAARLRTGPEHPAHELVEPVHTNGATLQFWGARGARKYVS